MARVQPVLDISKMGKCCQKEHTVAAPASAAGVGVHCHLSDGGERGALQSNQRTSAGDASKEGAGSGGGRHHNRRTARVQARDEAGSALDGEGGCN